MRYTLTRSLKTKPFPQKSDVCEQAWDETTGGVRVTIFTVDKPGTVKYLFGPTIIPCFGPTSGFFGQTSGPSGDLKNIRESLNEQRWQS